jgi:type IV pilus assembly protein PilX
MMKILIKSQQRGFVLIVSLIFLIIMTWLVITSIRRSTLDEKSAANMQSQNVAFQSAERALRFCESSLELDLTAGDKFCKKKEGLAGVLATVVIGSSLESPTCPPKQPDGNNPQANFPDCSEQKTNWSGANALAVTIAANQADPNFVPNVASQPQCMVEEWRFGNDLKGKPQNPAFIITARAVGSTANTVVWLQETIRCGKDGT